LGNHSRNPVLIKAQSVRPVSVSEVIVPKKWFSHLLYSLFEVPASQYALSFGARYTCTSACIGWWNIMSHKPVSDRMMIRKLFERLPH